MNNLKELYQLLKSDSIDIDAIELAESLWLSKYISKTEQFSSSDNNDGFNTDTKEKDEEILPPIDNTPPPPTNSKVKQLKEKKREDIPLHPISDNDNKNSLPFRTPLVRKLYKDNDLIFAFREFRQKIVSLKSTTLDEEKIADYIAKTDIFKPFYKKSYEKRFRVLFMVDSSESMKIWESLIEDFIKSVKNYHIFKEVMVCYISTDSQDPQLFKKKELTSSLNDRWYRHIDPNTIAFMFSDMMSKSWSSGVLLQQITLWQNHFPFAVVQMLPQRLWNGTKLIDASMGKMSSHKKFALNSQIVSRAEEILAREEEELPALVKIPLLNFNPNSIEAYGKIMRSLPNNRIEGALFEAEDFRGEYQLVKESSELNAEQRLRGFYKYASKKAKELLELLAVVPLSLPIVKLVQQKLLPQSTQEHLSEVFMSSIIDKEQKVDGFYQFSKYENEESGVREELIKKIGAKRAFQSIVKLSEVIQKQGGVFDFLAFVVDPDSLKQSDEFSEIDREFARISVAVLREMGGKYFKFADRLVECFEGDDDINEIKVVIPDSKRFILPYFSDDINFKKDDVNIIDPESLHDSIEYVMNYDYSISKYPISVNEYNIFYNEYYEQIEQEKSYIKDKIKNKEINGISWVEANEYCRWLSRKTNKEYRLPSYKEWLFANSAGRLNYAEDKYIRNEKDSFNFKKDIDTKNNPWNIDFDKGAEWCRDGIDEISLGKFNNLYKHLKVHIENPNIWDIILWDKNKYVKNISFHVVETNFNKIINSNNNFEPKMVNIINSLSIDTVKIPNRNYEMGKYPITIAEYMHFVRDTDSHYPKWMKKKDKYKNMNLTDNAPIIGVSWYDAVAYCEWLSEKTGKKYRLPTIEEWGYSCRAGTTTKWSFGDDENKLDKYAWYRNNSNGTTHIVGEKLPNPWGLYDMYGNVYEWSSLSHKSEHQYLFGGSWYHGSSYTFSKNYLKDDADRTSGVAGFRIIRELKEKKKVIGYEKKTYNLNDLFFTMRVEINSIENKKDFDKKSYKLKKILANLRYAFNLSVQNNTLNNLNSSELLHDISAILNIFENNIQELDNLNIKDDYHQYRFHIKLNEINTIFSKIERIIKYLEDKSYRARESNFVEDEIVNLYKPLQDKNKKINNLRYVFNKILSNIIYPYNKKNILFNNMIGNQITLKTHSLILEDIFYNIILNAFKYSYQGTIIKISSEIMTNTIHIYIKNVGLEIKNDEINDIFKFGYRGYATQKFEEIIDGKVIKYQSTEDENNGIGLYKAKALVQKILGGEIRLIREENNINIFDIVLPRNVLEEQKKLSKILWLEDESETIVLLKNQLKKYCNNITICDTFTQFTNELEELEDTSNTIIIINIIII